MWEIILPIFGLLIGTIASLTGIGGGAIIVPLLTLLYFFEPPNAVGTSLTTIIFTALAATLNYARQKRIHYKTGLVLATTTIPGAFLGAFLTTVIPPKQLGLIFGFFLIIVALRMIMSTRSYEKTETMNETKQPSGKTENNLPASDKMIVRGAALSFFGGLASGLLGIGGGVLIVPIMTFAMSMPIHYATATSMFTMIFTSTSGVAQHYLADHISIEYALPLALGTVLGAQLGAYTSKKISSKNLRRVFGIALLVVSIQMIIKYL